MMQPCCISFPHKAKPVLLLTVSLYDTAMGTLWSWQLNLLPVGYDDI